AYRSKTWRLLGPDRVQVALSDLVGAPDQLLDVVVLGVDVAAGEGVGPARGERAHQARRELRRSPGRVVRSRLRHLGLDQARADDENRDPAFELLGEHVSESPDRGLARRVRGTAGV